MRLLCFILRHKFKYLYGESNRYYECVRCSKQVDVPKIVVDGFRQANKLNLYLNNKGG